MARLEVYPRRLARRSQRWRWRLVASNGRKLANGGEGYAHVEDCHDMALRVCRGKFQDLHVTILS